MDQPQKLQEAIRLLYDNGWHLAAFRLRRGIWGPAEAAERLRMGIGTREPALASEAESKALSILDELSSQISEPKPATRSIDVTLERAREIMRFVEYWANERPGEAMILDLGDGDPGPWQSVTHTRERLGGRVRDRIDAVRLAPPVSEPKIDPPEGQGEALPAIPDAAWDLLAFARDLPDSTRASLPIILRIAAEALRAGASLPVIRAHVTALREIAHPDTGERSILDQALQILRGET
jgi:hypothetical protein